MVVLALAREIVAVLARRFLPVAQLDLERLQARLHLVALAGAMGNASLQLLDLALALQHAVQLRLRAMEDHALPAEEVYGARHEQSRGRKHARERHAVLALGQDEDVGECVAQVAGDPATAARYDRRQGLQIARRRGNFGAALDEYREVARRRVAQERRQLRLIGELDRIQ